MVRLGIFTLPLFLCLGVLAGVQVASGSDPRLRLQVLSKINSVVEKELSVLETTGSSNSISGMDLDKAAFRRVDVLFTGSQRFEEDLSKKVKDAAQQSKCSKDCTTAWRTLEDMYREYWACEGKCDEDVVRRRVQASEQVDQRCGNPAECMHSLLCIIMTGNEAGTCLRNPVVGRGQTESSASAHAEASAEGVTSEGKGDGETDSR